MTVTDVGGDDVEVERLFIGAGCNRIVNNVSWGPSGLVAFGAQNAVAVFCPETAQILTTLPGHNAIVNCTHWLPSNKDAYKVQHEVKHYLLSGSADGVIMLWEFHTIERKWSQALQIQKMHKKGVTCFTGLLLSENIGIFASTSSDGTVLVWELILPLDLHGECKISCLESLLVGSKPVVALSLSELPGDKESLVLATGGLDNKIHLYCGASKGKFVHVCELKAHSDWVRSLDFSLPVCLDGGKKSIFLVSSSQDKTIRIWKLALHSSLYSEVPSNKNHIGLASFIEGPLFVAGHMSYQVSLESLLVGHDDWVYSVKWHPPLSIHSNGLEVIQPLSILSASMDKTMMIWRPEKNTGIWVNMVTVGELNHTALGFYGGHWAPDGASILAHGYGGAFHCWKNVGLDIENWKPCKVPSGHFASVCDIAWSRSGEFVLSVSHDQTARIFSPWRDEACLGTRAPWHEIARPQVHGHDINCVSIIKGSGNYKFVSGAEEKVARVFEAPLSFLKTLSHAVLQISDIEDLHNVQILGANMSALGLSQKPIYVHATNEASKRTEEVLDSLETIPDAVPVVLNQPPVEDQLGWHTLWPESHKLYGHGNELFSLCCDHEGKLVASSCKAQSVAVAEIWLWEVGSWKALDRLQSHSLTVTKIEFSYDDAFLLAVSRDRQFSVFEIKKSGVEMSHQLISKQEGHKRIIWACSWNPFCHQFATGSRDKTVKIWAVDRATSSVKQITTLPAFKDSVTALSWLGLNQASNAGILAVGLDSGRIELWTVAGGINPLRPFNATVSYKFDPYLSHTSTVNRLAWSCDEAGGSRSARLASCGADNCVRVFEVRLK